MDFETWMKQVDKAIEDKLGMSSDDLPDMPYREMWEDGLAPAKAARKALKNAKD